MLGIFAFQYNSSPLLSLIKIKPDNSDFTSLVIPNCHPESAITNITFKVDNSAYVITVDPKNPKTYAQYTITLTASN